MTRVRPFELFRIIEFCSEVKYPDQRVENNQEAAFREAPRSGDTARSGGLRISGLCVPARAPSFGPMRAGSGPRVVIRGWEFEAPPFPTAAAPSQSLAGSARGARVTASAHFCLAATQPSLSENSLEFGFRFPNDS